ncbi:MAG: alpha-amylase/4-alpha-glucanotransferase domain-containing protein [Desulfatiglandaceae bacterium]
MLNLVMIFHCHQPVGNFDHVFEKAVDQCYSPVLKMVRDYPHVRLGFHVSGPLFEWLEQHDPATLDLLGTLVDRGQVEPLSGGFYEPLLATIPPRDARGQMEKMNDYLLSRFNYRPTGFWLTERVWDPSLPSVLSGTGMHYTIVDDTHFFYAGIKPDAIYGPYITEKEGKTLRLLATPMNMRYLIPFKPVEEVIAHLESLEHSGKAVAVYGDDCEKFGLWPGTHEWVIRKGWLKRFFEAIGENDSWIKTGLPGEFVKEMPALGRIYLPQASYEEMTEWALPPDRGEVLEDMIASLREMGRWDDWHPFVRGGVWDNFLVKYDEANRMHKKMLCLSERLGPDSNERISLWRGQCNCAYWHGVFGGLYLGHLRRAIYQNLLFAQRDLMRKSGDEILAQQMDFDKDGEEEILIWTPDVSLGISPAKGGGLFEIGNVRKSLDLSDVLTRRHEAYHRRLDELGRDQQQEKEGTLSIHEMLSAKDEGLEKLLVYDPYTRTSFLDHFVSDDCDLEKYAANDHEELGDFVQGRYLLEEILSDAEKASLVMTRKGRIGSSQAHVKKEMRLGKSGVLDVQWEVGCLDGGPIKCLYGCELNLTLFSDRDPERHYLINGRKRREVAEKDIEKDVSEFALFNGPDQLVTVFSFSRPVTVWFFPLMTVSMSEEGFERTYQGSSLLMLQPLDLSKGEKSSFECRMSFISL